MVQSPVLHGLLKKQLDQFGIVDPTVPPDAETWRQFLNTISTTYAQADDQEQALRKREMLYRTLVKNLPNVVVLMFDHEMRYILADGATINRYGYSRETFEGKTIWEAISEERVNFHLPYYQAALAGKESRYAIGSCNFSEFVVSAAVFSAFLVMFAIGHWGGGSDWHSTAYSVAGLVVGGLPAAVFGGYLSKRAPRRILTIAVGCLALSIAAYRSLFA